MFRTRCHQQTGFDPYVSAFLFLDLRLVEISYHRASWVVARCHQQSGFVITRYLSVFLTSG